MEILATKGETRRFRGVVQQVRKIIFFVKSIFLLKLISAIVFLARLGCRNDGSRRSCGEVRGEIDTKRLNGFTKLSYCEAS